MDEGRSKKIFAKNLNRYLMLTSKNQIEVARDLGILPTTFSTWCTAQRMPRMDKIEMLANYFGIKKSDLIEEKTDQGTFPSEIMHTFQVIGSIAAGYDQVAVEEYTGETIELPISLLHGRSAKDYFVLRVKGNSMYPQFLEGDMVLVLRTTSVDSGSVAVVLYNQHEATLKKVRYVSGEDWLELIPINPEYQTKLIKGIDLQDCCVLGKVIMLLRNI